MDDHPRHCLSIRVFEDVAVGREHVTRALNKINQLGAHVCTASVMRQLENVEFDLVSRLLEQAPQGRN